ncbi:MAG: hypothetical protein JXL97_15020 [Bacteroidales bacterium]|nr:hypothetical protein [Bacteroidales bacterium]
MKFNKLRKYRRIFYLLGIIAFLTIFVILQRNYKNTLCSNIKVTVLDSAENRYVTESSIINFIYNNIQSDIVGNKFRYIDLGLIEEKLNDDFFIKSVEVFRSQNGIIEIKITQRKPIARIYNELGENYYIDEDGYFLPTSKNFASYVPVFNGKIKKIDSLFTRKINVLDTSFKDQTHKDLYNLAKILKNDEFTLSMIDQVFVDENNEFIMIPKVGNFKIIFGTLENAEIKIRNLKAFYTEGAPKVGWNKYSAINLNYINQVVCTKRN